VPLARRVLRPRSRLGTLAAGLSNPPKGLLVHVCHGDGAHFHAVVPPGDRRRVDKGPPVARAANGPLGQRRPLLEAAALLVLDDPRRRAQTISAGC
jgi:hypothetical protein